MPLFYAVFNLDSPWAQQYAEVERDHVDDAHAYFAARFGAGTHTVYTEAGWRNWQGLSVAQRGNLRKVE